MPRIPHNGAMPQAATQYNIIIGSVPATARPRAVCVSEHQGAGWSVSGISEKGRCVSGCREHQGGCREHQGRREHQDAGRDIGPPEGRAEEGCWRQGACWECIRGVGHTLRRVSEVRQDVCRGVGRTSRCVSGEGVSVCRACVKRCVGRISGVSGRGVGHASAGRIAIL